MKRLNTFTVVLDTGLQTSSVITKEVSIAEFASGANLMHLNTSALRETSLLFSLATAIT